MFTPDTVHLLLMYKPGMMRSKTTRSHTPRNVTLTALLSAVVQSVPTTLRYIYSNSIPHKHITSVFTVGANPFMHLTDLKTILKFMGCQWRNFNTNVICALVLVVSTSAAAFLNCLESKLGIWRTPDRRALKRFSCYQWTWVPISVCLFDNDS